MSKSVQTKQEERLTREQKHREATERLTNNSHKRHVNETKGKPKFKGPMSVEYYVGTVHSVDQNWKAYLLATKNSSMFSKDTGCFWLPNKLFDGEVPKEGQKIRITIEVTDDYQRMGGR